MGNKGFHGFSGLFRVYNPYAIIGEKRLSLTSNTPVTGDVTAATRVYWTDGETNLSVAVPATTVTPFDVFYSLSGNCLSTVNWANDTTRAVALARDTYGRRVKSGDTEKLYLGWGRTTSVSGQCEKSFSKLFLRNHYNPKRVKVGVYESTNSWSSDGLGAWRAARGQTSNRVEILCDADEPIILDVAGCCKGGAGGYGLFGIAVDATNTNDCATDGHSYLGTFAVNNHIIPTYGRLNKVMSEGYHYFQWTEVDWAVVITFYSKNSTFRQSGISGFVMA